MQTPQTQDAAVQINAVVDHLASKLAVPASQLWSVLMREARIEGVLDSLIGGLLIASALFGGRFIVRYGARKCEDDHYSEWEWGSPLCVVGAVLMSIVGVCFLYSAVTELLNPQYVAATTILHALQPKP